MSRTALPAALMLVVLSACAGVGTEPAADASPTASTEATPMTQPTNSPTDRDAAGGTLDRGEIPEELFEAVIADALERANASREEVAVVEARAVTWNDGSLGCPEPGMAYTQALVEGYQLVLEIGEATLDYRLTEGGSFKLCES